MRIKKYDLIKMFNDGLWYEDISLKYGICSRQVRSITASYGIVLERRNKSVKVELEIKTCKFCGKQYTKSKNEGYCSYNCIVLESNKENIFNSKLTTNNEIGVSVINLKVNGLSHNEISKILGCSKSTVSYYCNKNVSKNKTAKTNCDKKLDCSTYRFEKMLNNFKSQADTGWRKVGNDWNKKIRMSVIKFKERNCMSKFERNTKYKYTYHEAIEHLGGMQTKCYLTGTPIDISKDRYSLDHKIPVSKGGDNSLKNMGITIPIANYSKSSMDLNEYLDLCRLVLEYNGYEVNII